MKTLEIKNVYQWFGDNKVLHDINLYITSGQIVALVGPSGCGKSTLLRAVLGTHPPKKGEVYTGDRLVTKPSRDVGIVYQHYSLYSFLTAQENIAFGLMVDQTSIPFRFFRPFAWRKLRKQHLKEAGDFLDKLLLGKAKNKYPSELSGGMRQRVAIAQALVMKPKILLLDEPFGALDEATREELQLMLLHLYQENLEAKKKGQEAPYTVLIVTHELNEAIYVSDRVLGLSQFNSLNLDADGNFENIVGATIVYDKPAPVYHPTDQKEYSHFIEQREELREKVFDPTHNQHHQECVTFWSDLQKQTK